MKILIGDIFQDKAQTMVNTVNCVGVMGKGVALEFKRRYPKMYDEYVELCKQGQVRLGQPYYYSDLIGTSIINFPTKDHWKSPSRLSYIESGLKWFVENYRNLGIRSIAFPPLGCGNGGLSWENVGPLMFKYLRDLPIDITIYAPFGTKKEQLTEDYLYKAIIGKSDIVGSKSIQINPKWLLILHAVIELNTSKYSLHVGRIIFQKLCYVITRCGVETGFDFIKGAYGPYSTQVKNAITALSNSNYIAEHPYGNAIITYVNPKIKLDKKSFSESDLLLTDKTIDLFRRIKGANQAEVIATVMFSADELTKGGKIPTEDEIFSYVLEWKPKWKETNMDLAKETIRELASSGWIKASFSDNFWEVDDCDL